MSVIDTRVMIPTNSASANKPVSKLPMAWCGYLAHGSSRVTSVDWNPHVPYWLASSSANGTVFVWDLRYQSKQGAVGRLNQYMPTVASVSWSKNHIDLLATVGGDTLQLHNCKPDLLMSTSTIQQDAKHTRAFNIGADLVAEL